MRRINFFGKFSIIALFFAVIGFSANAQNTDALGTYTPYSLFGVGELEKQGTSFNKGMGGIGTGVRDNRYINYLNPAAITARDTLSFMFDFGASQKNFYNTDGKVESAFNTANMQNVVFTAPIYNKSALIVGISPYSNIGYKFRENETDSEIIAKYGDIAYEKYGEGSINQFFIGAATNIGEHFSVGAQMLYYFGNLSRKSNVDFVTDLTIRDINTGWDYRVNALSAKAGVQYFNKINGNLDLTVGAAYRFASNLEGDHVRYATAVGGGSATDTIRMESIPGYKVEVPSEFSFGFSLRKQDKWMVGFDYMMQDWSGSEFGEDDNFKACASNSFRVGVEYIPNRHDIRYYLKRVTYRAGAYYDQTYFNIGGSQVEAYGFTFGMSMPVFRWYNAISWSVDMGQRGSLDLNQVRERYIQLNLNLNLHDLWFIKRKYN
jgi:hypothetical protein